MIADPLTDAVIRLQEQLQALQSQFIHALIREAGFVVLLYLAFLVGTFIAARLVLTIGRALGNWITR